MTERSARAEDSASREAVRAAARSSRFYLDALRGADPAGAYRIAQEALAQGLTIPQLYQRVIAPAMYEIGTLWEKGAITVADEHLATGLTHRVLAALRPPPRVEAAMGGPAPRGRVMLAAIEGEQHALGLRMVADVLEDVGFHTIYLGADVPSEALLQALSCFAPDMLALSVTMSELAPRLQEVAGAARKAHPGIGLLVGGQGASAPEGDEGALVGNLEALAEAGWKGGGSTTAARS